MSSTMVLLLGLGLGLRHAVDVDHVAVVSGLVQREHSLWRATRIAATWGAGHTVTFLTLGLLIVLGGVRPSEAFERAVETLVAVILVGLGAFNLWRRSPPSTAEEAPAHPSAQPLLIGLVHGLAGSAGVALLAATTIGSPLVATAYLALVALGTVLGMVLLTLSIGWALGREGRLRTTIAWVAPVVSMAVGLLMILELATGT